MKRRRLPTAPALLAAALALPFLAVDAVAQQFISRSLPGPEVWSEAVVPLDADGDGLLDVLIVNAQGWAVPGDFDAPNPNPLPPTLLRNTGNGVDGDPVFVDASASFLPAGLVMHGKAAAVADFDGDGHDDIAFAAAYGDQQRLLRKNPVSGAWEDETAMRLPPLVLNGFSVVAGDLDDDGDFDLVFADAGPNSFTAPGGLARLLINDGTGVFTEAPSQLNAVLKVGAQNAKLVDIDGDLDIDVVIDGKSQDTQLYLNDGTANFTLDTLAIPGSTVTGNNTSTYETEFADLDGDSDVDAFLMNWDSGFFDTLLVNKLAESGELALRPAPAALVGPNSEDENDFAFLDTDDDGDLDLLVGALPFSSVVPPPPEKLYINDGTLGPGSLNYVPGAFDVISDATLDLGLGDFDGDDDYDVVSVQGEFLPFRNVYHRNVGPADTHAPVIPHLSAAPAAVPAAAFIAGLSRRAWVQDGLVDDETNYLEADLVIETAEGAATGGATVPMQYVGGGIWRGVASPAPLADGLVGVDVTYHVEARDPCGNVGSSASVTTRVCGTEPYGTAAPDGDLAFSVLGQPSIGAPITLQVSGGAPGVAGTLIIGSDKLGVPFKGGTLLVDVEGALLIAAGLDGAGELSLPAIVPDDELLVGLRALLQYVAFDPGQVQGAALSNGIELVVCP